MFYAIKKTFHPEYFHGNRKSKNYFEGWYYKLVSKDAGSIHAIIPGVSFGKNREQSHSFIQIINGKNGRTKYFSFDIGDFSYSRDVFQIRIGSNCFSGSNVSLNIETEDDEIRGSLDFYNLEKLPMSIFSPGIMGWYTFVPFMECYHGIISLDHGIGGELYIDGEKIDYNGGSGYIEKDWGQSFPSSWIWMQSNHFHNRASFMLSIARIPWLRSHFVGFLSVLMIEGEIYKFATYTGARIVELEISNKGVLTTIESKSHVLRVNALSSHAGLLRAPVSGVMDRRIAESIDAVIELSLYDRDNTQLYSGRGVHAGLEIVGKRELLAI
jgi:tocopherol cyclase